LNFISINGKCWDKCGTGRRFSPQLLPGLGGYNACDDGNLINGDGCSSDCRIESNYRCEGGNSTQADKCYSKIKPSVDVKKVYNNVFQF
jgi:cysteine-rich repeat protein